MSGHRKTPKSHTADDANGLDQSRWRRRCEGLTKIGEASTWSVEADLVYQRMTDVVAEVLQCSQAHLHLMTVGGERFIKRAYHADEKQQVAWKDALPATTGRMQWMLKTHEPIVMDYVHPHCEDRIPVEAVEFGFKSAVSIPLVADEEMVGICSVVYASAIVWDDEGLEYLLMIGRILGVSIRRMQVTKKAAELQMLDERKRLSSEIHDNISQLVGSLSLHAAAALASYDAHDDEAVHDDLERLEVTGGKIMRILRDEMLSLRIPLERTDGLLLGIKDCIRRFEENWGIPVEFQVKTARNPLVVPLQTSLQLTRILNECLSNTLRHAVAATIRVTVEEGTHYLTMTVEDDGCGFDLQEVSQERLGIKIMHERADAAGGKLTIISDEKGTTVCVDIPKNRMNGVGGSLA